MSVWRLEWLRLVRTRRLVVLAATFAFFGLAGPITIYYLPELLASRLSELKLTLPPPAPADGITEFSEALSGIGLIVVVAVSAGALCLDANPTLAAFYRTRVTPPSRLMLPRYAMTTAAVVGAFLLGTLAAWYETVVLLGAVPAPSVIAGALLGALYLAFVVAVVSIAAALVRSTLATVGVALCALFALPIAAVYEPLHRWAPSTLAGGFAGLLGDESLSTYSGPAAVAAVLAAAMLLAAAARLGRREV